LLKTQQQAPCHRGIQKWITDLPYLFNPSKIVRKDESLLSGDQLAQGLLTTELKNLLFTPTYTFAPLRREENFAGIEFRVYERIDY
jgi:hypothetical protein